MKYSFINRNTLPKVIFIIFALYFMSGIAYSQEYDVKWKHTQGADNDTTDNTITKTADNGWNNCGAISYNRLRRNDNGYVKYIITDINTKKAFGLSTNNNAPRLRSIDYGFVLNNKKILIIEHGKLKGHYGKVKIGDSLRIVRNNNKIKYYKNNILLRKRGTNPNFKLFVDVSIYTNGASFRGLKTSFARNIRILYTKEDVDCFTRQDSGKIILDIRGGVSPYNITWNTGQTTEIISNLSKGTYTVTVTDQLGLEKIKSIKINTAILWNIDTGIVIVNDSLQKTTNNGWGNSGAHSYNKIDSLGSGYLTFTIEKPLVKKAIGFSSENVNSHFNTIGYCFVISQKKLFIYKNGQFKGRYGKVKKGTVLKIKKNGNKFYFYKNGKLKKKLNCNETKQYFVDIAMFKQNSFLEPIFVDFCPALEDIKINYTTEINGCDSGSVYVTVTGGIPPYTYSWSNGLTDSSLTNVPRGEYTLTVTDYSGTSKTAYITLFPELIWTDLVGVEVKADTLLKTAENGWGNGGAASENILLSDEDGFVSYILKDNSTKVIGLSHINEDAHYNNIDYGFFSSKGEIYIIEDGKLVGEYGFWKFQVKLKIEKQGNKIFYWMDDKLVRETNINIPKSLKVDVSLYNQGSYFNDVKVSFCKINNLLVTYQVQQQTMDSLGAIKITEILGGQPPYYVVWGVDSFPTLDDVIVWFDTIPSLDTSGYTPEEYYHKMLLSYLDRFEIASLKAGKYKCLVFDSLRNEIQLQIKVGAEFLVGNTGNCQLKDNIITVDDITENAFIFIVNPIIIGEEDYNVISPVKDSIFGYWGWINYSDTSFTDFHDIKYGFFFDDYGKYYVIINGDTTKKIGNYNKNDEFKIQTEDSVVKFYNNNNLIFVSSEVSKDTVINTFYLKSCVGCVGSGKEIWIKEPPHNLPVFSPDFNIIDPLACKSPAQMSFTTDNAYTTVDSIHLYNEYSYSRDMISYTNCSEIQYLFPGKYTIEIYYHQHSGFGWASSHTSIYSKILWIGQKVINWDNKDNSCFDSNNGNTTLSNTLSYNNTVCTNNDLSCEYLGGANCPVKLYETQPGWIQFSVGRLPDFLKDINQIPVGFQEIGFSVTGYSPCQVQNNFMYSIKIYSIQQQVAPPLPFIDNNGNIVYPSSSNHYVCFLYTTENNPNPIGDFEYYSDDTRPFIIDKDINGNINYYLGSDLFFTETLQNPANDFFCKAIFRDGGEFLNVRTSFGCSRPDQFASLKRDFDAGYYIVNHGKLLFKYYEEYDVFSNNNLKWRIFKPEDPQTNILDNTAYSNPIGIHNGTNFLIIDLKDGNMETNKFYILEVKNSKNEKWFLKFKIKK